MSKLTRNYEQLAASMGFRLDAVRNVIYGQRAGFEFMIYAANPSYPYILSVTLGAKSQIGTLAKEDIKQFVKSVKPITNLTQEGSLLTLVLSSRPQQAKLCEDVNVSVNALIGYLQSRGFIPCCQFCGQQAPTAGYASGGSYMHLCSECAGRMRQDVSLAVQKTASKKENMIGGIVGALLGSVIGVICILIFGQLNRVAAISGIVMAVCTIKGYELLGGKLTKKGVVISILMMILMTYAGNRLDYAIAIKRAYTAAGIFDAFNDIPKLIEIGVIERGYYISNLVLLYIFTALGAVPTVWGTLQERKEEGQFVQIGTTNNMNNY